MGCNGSKNIQVNEKYKTNIPNIPNEKFHEKNKSPEIINIVDNTNTSNNSNQENINIEKSHIFREIINSRNFRSNSISINYIENEKDNDKKNKIFKIISKSNNDQLFDSINWVEKYKPSIKEYELLKNEITMEYKERIKSQLQTYFINLDNPENIKVETSGDGTVYTHTPQTIFFLVENFIKAIKEKLSEKYVKEMIIIILQLLRDRQRQTYDNLENNWMKTEEDVFCAMVNDRIKIVENLKKLIEEYKNKNTDEMTTIIYDCLSDELYSEYDKMELKIIDTLIKKILTNFNKDYFFKLFTDEWEKNEENLTEIYIETLKDYFYVIHPMIVSENHINYFNENICKETIHFYIRSLKNKKNKSFSDILTIINKIGKDKEIMKKFFEKYCNKKIIEDIDIIDTICKIMLSRNFENCKKETDKLCVMFGSDGLNFSKQAFNLNPKNIKKY